MDVVSNHSSYVCGYIFLQISNLVMCVCFERDLGFQARVSFFATKCLDPGVSKHKKMLTVENRVRVAECPKSLSKPILDSLGHVFESKQFADISVTAFDSEFRLHKVILLSNAYFNSILTGSWIESECDAIHLSFDDRNISLEALCIVLRRIYGQFDPASLHENNVLSLLATGAFFGDESLCATCADFVCRNLDEASLANCLAFSDEHFYGLHSKTIFQQCISYLCKNLSLYPDLVSIVPLPWLFRILTSDCLYVASEKERFHLISHAISSCNLFCGSSENLEAVAAALRWSWVDSELKVEGEVSENASTETAFPHNPANVPADSPTHASICSNLMSNIPSLRHKESNETLVEMQNSPQSSVSRLSGENIDNFHYGEVLDQDKLSGCFEFCQETEGDYRCQLPADETCEAALLADRILSNGVIFSHLSPRDLTDIKSRASLDLEKAVLNVITKAEQHKTNLMKIVSEANGDCDSFGICYQEHPMQLVSSLEAASSDKCASMSALLQKVQHPTLWNLTSSLPPFRFGCEFSVEQLEKARKSRGQNVYSSKVYYGGSMWMPYIKVATEATCLKFGSKGDILGIFLQREPIRRGAEEIGLLETGFEDTRPEAKVWFKVAAHSISTVTNENDTQYKIGQLMNTLSPQSRVLETTQNFKYPGCWGWPFFLQAHDVYQSADVPQREGLKCAIVLGLL
ncbi:hypothetical protein BJ741DRAFT_238893 [Chytriomyces cf. hyalinus JEL632]|nr:hypothetical protein BJ741DRAFT_238893 [Chytriomyces cf. hyalinus JEL632]